MRILTNTNTLRVEVVPNDGSRWRKELMTEEYVLVKFQRKSLVQLHNGDYINFENKKYEIVKVSRPKWNTSKGCWEYEQKFYAEWEKWKNRKFFFNRQSGNFEKTWSLTQYITYFLDLVIDNVKAAGLGNDWEYQVHGNELLSAVKNITFDGVSIFDGVTAIAKTWDTEWWIVGHKLHIGKCELGTAVTFEIGDIISDMTASESDGRYATRLYAFGSTRNIPKNYRGEVSQSVVDSVVEKRLMLPSGTNYVDAWENLADDDVVESIAIFDDIYPRRVGTISAVQTKEYTDTIEEEGTTTEVTWNAYRFKDSGLTFNTDYMIDGQELRIVFQTGLLAGCDFAVAFNPDGVADETSADAQLFEIIRNEDYGVALPNDTLYPVAGNTYILYGFDTSFVGNTYVPAAEQELLAAARARIAEMVKDDNTYSCPTDPVRCAGYYIANSGELTYDSTKKVDLDVGQKVTLVNEAYFGENNRESRILAFEKDVNNLYKCTYDCGKSAKYSVFSSNDEVKTVTYEGRTYVSEENIATGTGGKGVDLSSLKKSFLSKVTPDTAKEKITFEKGADFGMFSEGSTGAGLWQDGSGNWHCEADFLHARKKLTAKELQIEETTHIGGAQLLTAASMVCDFVVDKTTHWRCFFLKTDGSRQVTNKWKVNDQAYVSTFNLTGNHFLWRLVTGTSNDTADTSTYIVNGETYDASDYHYIDLSKSECASNSDAPQAGDHIVQLGYQGTDSASADRKNAIIQAGAGTGSPYIREYTGINSFTLPSPETQLKPGANKFSGEVNMSAGSTINGSNILNTLNTLSGDVSLAQDAADEARSVAVAADARIDALSSGAENLLRNSGFTGDYTSESVTDGTEVNAGTQMYSDAFDHWTKTNATAGTNASSASGVAVTLSNGSLTQTLERTIAAGTKCIFSFRGSGTSLTFSLGGYSKTITLGNSIQLYQEAFVTSSADSTFTITAATGVIMELMLIEGTIPNGNWINSPKDNDKTLAYFQALSFLTDAIENNNTNILGGLILTQLIKVGYMQNSVRQITGGMNGLANNDDSPFLWGGGTLDQAAATITAYANDPTYQPTQAELQSLAKFVVTHGGRAILNDIIMRGIVYATGGKFSGSNGMYGIELDADSQTIKCKSPSEVTSPSGTTPVSGATEIVSFEIESSQNNLPYSDGNGNLRYFPYRSLTLRNNTPYGEAYVVISPTGIHFVLPKPNNENVSVDLGIDTFRISPDVIPTDPTYLLPGTIYRDSNGFLKIVTS